MNQVETESPNAQAVNMAFNELRAIISQRLKTEPKLHGRCALELFIKDGRITGHEINARHTRKHAMK